MALVIDRKNPLRLPVPPSRR